MRLLRGARGAWVAGFAAALLATACGGSRPPGPLTPGEAKAPPVLAEAPPDLSPVAAPEDLVVAGRLKNPALLLDTVGTWSGFPLDWRGLVAAELPGLERVIAWEAPIELAAVLDPQGKGMVPQPFLVFSAGLTSLDAAVKLAEKAGARPGRVRPGVFRLRRSEGLSCALAAAVGRAPARLVCGERAEDLDALLPYATRGLPNEPLADTDFYLELRAAPLRRRFGGQLKQLKAMALPFALRQMSLDHPRFDRALADAIHLAADELVALSDELERITLAARLEQNLGQLEITSVLELSATESLTANVLLDASARSGPAPEGFWKLPASATAASFDQGADPKRYTALQRTLAELAGGFVEHAKTPRATAQRVVELVETAPIFGRALVYAEGDLPRSQARPADPAARMRHDFGWRWYGFAEPAAGLRKWLDGLVAVTADRTLRRVLEERFELVPGALPTVKRRPAKGMAPGSTTYEIALPAELAGGRSMLPALLKSSSEGSKAKGEPAQRPITMVAVLVPDGDRAWVGLAGEEASLAAPLRAIRQGGETDRLQRRAGLEWLRQLNAAAGGFLSLRTFAADIASLAEGEPGKKAPAIDHRGILDALPERGETPILYATTIRRERGLRASWTLLVPKAVFKDGAAVLPSLVATGVPGTVPPTPP